MRKKKNKEEIPTADGLYPQAISFAIEAFRSGESEQSISKYLQEAYPILNSNNIQLILTKASQQITSEYKKDQPSIISIHVQRYNKEIRALKSQTYKNYSSYKRRKFRIQALELMLSVLFAKERVLQLHTKDTQVKIYNTLNAKVKEKKFNFNLKNLSFEQKLEFLQLLDQMKRTQSEVFSVQLENKQTNTEDVEVEVVSSNTHHIQPIPIVNQDPPKEEVKKDINDITEKIKESLRKKAKEEFRKKNAKNIAPVVIDFTKINKPK